MKKPEVEYIGGEPVRKMLPPTIFSRLFPRGVNAYGHRVKGEIEKIVATPQVFESYFGIDYRNDIHPAVGAILSQGEHEFLKNKIPESFGRRPTSKEIAPHELEWARVVKNVVKGKILPEQVRDLQLVTPHMLENFAEIEDGSSGNFANLIHLGNCSKKAKLIEQYEEKFDKAA